MVLSVVLPAVLLSASSAISQSTGPTVSVRATAVVSERISLSVSAEVLQFVVEDGSDEAAARIEFTAGVRAVPGRDVLLMAEPAGDLEAAAGPVSGGELRFAGEGDAMLSGVLVGGAPRIVARWTGGGQRRGTIVFHLRGAAPGAYSMPVRLLVSVP
jgi:hypothetical protein